MENIKQAIDSLKDTYTSLVTRNGDQLNFEREKGYLLDQLHIQESQGVKLNSVSAESIANALFNAGGLGLSLHPALGYAIVSLAQNPYGMNNGKLIVTYKGLLHLCYEAKALTHFTSWVIYEKDRVSLSSDVFQKPKIDIADIFGDRGNMVGAICTICTPNGEYLTTRMTAQELNEVANASGNLAWYGPFADEFRKKQVLKRALKTMLSTYDGRLLQASLLLSTDDKDCAEGIEVPCSTQKPTPQRHTPRAKKRSKGGRSEQFFKVSSNEPDEANTAITDCGNGFLIEL